jgi:coenzyme F420-0:L-glutamate ligase/coenzyme F420-1:gamma-L-glutamate ligase
MTRGVPEGGQFSRPQAGPLAVSAVAVAGLPEIAAGDSLATLIAERTSLTGGDIVCVAHKVVSKAEGRVVALSDVQPSARAVELAGPDKDPRAVEVVLRESESVLRAERGVIVSRTSHGFVCANAGVDTSNAARDGEVVLLPADPDASARALRAALPGRPAVLITDSFGRAWRHGQVDVCVGLAGLAPLDDWRGRVDARGMSLRATWLAVADAVAAAADLVRVKDAGQPVVVVSGLQRVVTAEDGPGAAVLVRPPSEDLFP